jgi:hypothetical protein
MVVPIQGGLHEETFRFAHPAVRGCAFRLAKSCSHHAPAGALPVGMPSRMVVGLFEQWGGTWMRDSAVPWDVRYAYFTKGGLTTGAGVHTTDRWPPRSSTNAAPSTRFPLFSSTRCRANPAAVKVNSSESAERRNDGNLLRRFQIADAAREGFSQAGGRHARSGRLRVPRATVEPERECLRSRRRVGIPELAGLPNTVAGWGMAFLQLRKSIGATNVVLGVHVSGWASGKDIVHYS